MNGRVEGAPGGTARRRNEWRETGWSVTGWSDTGRRGIGRGMGGGRT